MDDAVSTPRRSTRDGLFWLLKHAQIRLATLGETAFEPFGITGRQLAVLGAVADGDPASQLDAAARLGVDRTTMVALLDELESRGLVERRPDPADRRRNLVALTEQGRDTFIAASRAMDEVEAAFLAPLPERDRERLRAMLRAVVDG